MAKTNFIYEGDEGSYLKILLGWKHADKQFSIQIEVDGGSI